ncbi:hypothetical protein NL676_036980 [Syzygium grande]|nr:hypothetical protein NL676_036980 [Syzygium grande]
MCCLWRSHARPSREPNCEFPLLVSPSTTNAAKPDEGLDGHFTNCGPLAELPPRGRRRQPRMSLVRFTPKQRWWWVE